VNSIKERLGARAAARENQPIAGEELAMSVVLTLMLLGAPAAPQPNFATALRAAESRALAPAPDAVLYAHAYLSGLAAARDGVRPVMGFVVCIPSTGHHGKEAWRTGWYRGVEGGLLIAKRRAGPGAD
jgi:hypothetical protein